MWGMQSIFIRQDKLDVGERLALWALKNDYGRTSIVPSGPVLRDVTVSGTNLICSFDYVGAGLMAGFKKPYFPTVETNAPLARFVIAGSGGAWYAANAVISNDTVLVSSPSVAAPRKVAYAYWTNPSGANLYNRDGLPASPFYVEDVTVKYTVTASAGAGGSISPAGATTYLRRSTALYTITPDAGNYILDVKVDGASVGAVRHFTFDPLYANHTIAASFTNAQPAYAVTASAGPGGSISPSGSVVIAQGGAQSFTVTPTPGALTSVAVDGRPMGARDTFTFSDVRTNHTIAANFSFSIQASSGYGGSISSPGVSVLPYGANQTYTITPAATYAVLKVVVDGVNVGAVTSYTFTNVTTNHTISASFSGGSGGGSVPQQSQLLFSCLVDSLPASGAISCLAGLHPRHPGALENRQPHRADDRRPQVRPERLLRWRRLQPGFVFLADPVRGRLDRGGCQAGSQWGWQRLELHRGRLLRPARSGNQKRQWPGLRAPQRLRGYQQRLHPGRPDHHPEPRGAGQWHLQGVG